MSGIENRVKDLIVEQLGVKSEDVTPDATLKDLGVDSLDAVELILAIERTFDVHIPDEKSPQLDTMRKMVGYLNACTEQ